METPYQSLILPSLHNCITSRAGQQQPLGNRLLQMNMIYTFNNTYSKIPNQNMNKRKCFKERSFQLTPAISYCGTSRRNKEASSKLPEQPSRQFLSPQIRSRNCPSKPSMPSTCIRNDNSIYTYSGQKSKGSSFFLTAAEKTNSFEWPTSLSKTATTGSQSASFVLVGSKTAERLRKSKMEESTHKFHIKTKPKVILGRPQNLDNLKVKRFLERHTIDERYNPGYITAHNPYYKTLQYS